jgi:DNA-directed RNA polymerase
MKKQVNMPSEVKEILEAQQRMVRSTLINYAGSETTVEEDTEPSESDAVMSEQVEEDAPKKRGRPQKEGAIKTKVKRKVEVDKDADDGHAEYSSKRFLTEIERQAGGDKKKMRELLSKHFVPLIDILPPLPMKGDFDIELIKQSPYFFS